MSTKLPWRELECLTKRLFRLDESMCRTERRTEIAVCVRAQWVKLQGAAVKRDSVFETASIRCEHARPANGGGIPRGELQRTLERSFGSLPIPVVGHLNPGHLRMRFRQVRLQCERPLDRISRSTVAVE